MMFFTPQQIAVTLISFLGVLVLAFLWRRKDAHGIHEGHENRESFAVLMSVFFWAAFFTLLFRMGLDLLVQYDTAGAIYTTHWFFVLSLFVEEIIKIAALLIGVELAGQRFNELGDGIIYTVFAALGFLFFENILYLSPYVGDQNEFVRIFIGRNVFAFGAHLFTTVFGIFYAFAYLHSKKQGNAKRVEPWRIFEHFRHLLRQFGWLFPLWLPFSPFITLWKFFSHGLKMLSIPEMLWSGFLLSSYLHIGYDYILFADIPTVQMYLFPAILFFVFILYKFFPKMEVAIKD